MQLAAAGLVCAWLMGQTGVAPPGPAPNSAAPSNTRSPATTEPELPVALPPAATPVVPGTEAPPRPAALKTRLDRVRAENADLPVPTKIEVQNQMGKRFRLVAASFVIDGAPAFEREVPKGKEHKGKELSLSNGPISVLVPTGDHVLTATLTYEGRNVGPFTYMDDTRYRVESTIPFSTSHLDGPRTIHVVASERKGANVPFEKIPQLTLNLGPAAPPTGTQDMVARPQPPAPATPAPISPAAPTTPRPGLTPARATTPK